MVCHLTITLNKFIQSMLRFIWAFLLIFLIQLCPFKSTAEINKIYGDASLTYFKSNAGQWDKDVHYRLISNGYAISFFNNKVSFAISRQSDDKIQNTFKEKLKLPELDYLVWEIVFEGSEHCIPIGEGNIPSIYRFFGNGSCNGKTIDLFKKIVYKNIYPQTDLVFYVDSKKQIKYDFILHPGGDISKIKMKYNGIEGLKLNEHNDLNIKTVWGDFKENTPFSFQQINGQEMIVDVKYFLANNNTLTFESIKDLDRTKTLIIDPVLLDWSTYFYGNSRFNIDNSNQIVQYVGGVDIDSKGYTYVAGTTNQDFPKIPGLHNSKPGNFPSSKTDAYYCKISPKGDSFLFFNYLGGANNDMVNTLHINSKEEAVITGYGGPGFPFTKGALDTNYGGFVTTFNSTGDSIRFSTFFHPFSGNNAIITESGEVIIAGACSGGMLVTSGAYQNKYQGGSVDGFVAKIKSDGKSLSFSTYIGGDDMEEIYGISINSKEDIYLVGYTRSNNFPINTSNNSFKYLKGGADGFLLKLDNSGSKVLFSDVIGGSYDDFLQSIFINPKEEIFVSGFTNSNNFPVSVYPIAHQASNAGKYDLVAMKFLPNGSNYKYSTYIGGSDNEYCNNWINGMITQIAVNAKDEAIIMGVSQSNDFPVTSDALQKTNKAKAKIQEPLNLTLTKLSFGGDKLIYSTYFGGGYSDNLLSGRIKRFNCVTNIVIAGATMSRDFPTTTGSIYPNAPKDTLFGNGKHFTYAYVSFISKFSDTLKVEKPSFGNRTKTRCNDFLEILDGLNQGSYRRWSTGDSSQFLLVNKAGTYWVATTYGCDTIRDSITIINPINKANFTILDTAQCLAGNSFTFKETTQFKNTKHKESSWYFDDSTSIMDTIAKKSFTTPGIHFIKLVSQSTADCMDSITTTVHVYPNTQPNFVINDTSQCLKNQNFNYTNTSTDTGKISYQWDLGDQTFSNQKNISAKTYLKDSSYVIKLISTTDKNCEDTATKIISIKPSPVADFKWDIACSRTVTNFKYTGSKPIQSFHWNFNNEATSTLENPSHKFAAAGTSISTLTLTSSNGCSDTLKKSIDIKPQSQADFTTQDVCENTTTDFVNTSKDATSYNWKFGDGNTSNLQSPKHQYQISGKSTTFNVTLVAIVANGCSDSISKATTVNANPSADFSYTTGGKQVNFTATETAATLYQWTFGDGGTVNTATPKTTYNYTKFPSGKYTACLKVINAANCFSESCKEIVITGGIANLSEKSFKIYPNPNNGSFTIEIENPENDGIISIYNTIGMQIKTIETNSSQSQYLIKLDFNSGLYSVKIESAGKVFYSKFIKL